MNEHLNQYINQIIIITLTFRVKVFEPKRQEKNWNKNRNTEQTEDKNPRASTIQPHQAFYTNIYLL